MAELPSAAAVGRQAGHGAGRADRWAARAAGYLPQIAAPDALEATAERVCRRLAVPIAVTQRASKAMLNRLLHASLPEVDGLVHACYGSADFRAGMRASVAKRAPAGSGRRADTRRRPARRADGRRAS